MDTNLVVIATYNYSRALLLRGRLESEGIECYLSNINLVNPDISLGVKVLIKKEDVAAATRIIKSISKEYGEEAAIRPALYKIHRILVPVDFSDSSLNACDYAVALAARLNAEIKLVHAYYDPPAVASAFPDAFSYELGMGGLQKDLENAAKTELAAFKDNIIKRALDKGITDVKVTAKLVHGIAETEIKEVAKSYKPHLIVIANKGKGKASSPIGHVTSELIDTSKFPVFAIPDKALYKRIENNKVLYITDFEDPDFSSFRKLMSIISPFNMEVLCVHIGTDQNQAFDTVQMEELQDKLNAGYGDFHIECQLVSNPDIIAGIQEMTESRKIDIIAMSNRKHNLLYRLFKESNARKLLYHTSIPLLVFQLKS